MPKLTPEEIALFQKLGIKIPGMQTREGEGPETLQASIKPGTVESGKTLEDILAAYGITFNTLPSSGSSLDGLPTGPTPEQSAAKAEFMATGDPSVFLRPAGDALPGSTALQAPATEPNISDIVSWLSAGQTPGDQFAPAIGKETYVPPRGPQGRTTAGGFAPGSPGTEGMAEGGGSDGGGAEGGGEGYIDEEGIMDAPSAVDEGMSIIDPSSLPSGLSGLGSMGQTGFMGAVESALSDISSALGYIPGAVVGFLSNIDKGLIPGTVQSLNDIAQWSISKFNEQVAAVKADNPNLSEEDAAALVRAGMGGVNDPGGFEGGEGQTQSPATGTTQATDTPEQQQTQFGSANIDEMMSEITGMSQALHDSTVAGLTSINDDFNEFINTSMSENKDLATQYDLWQEGSITALQNMANEYKQEMDSFGGRYDLLDEKYGNLADNMATLTSTHQAAMDRLIDPANRIGISGFGLEDFKLMPINTLAAASRHYGNMLSGLQSVGDVYGRQGGLLGEQVQGVSDKYSDLSNLLKAEIGTGLTGLGAQQDLMSGRQDLGMTGFNTNLQNLMTGYGAGRENLDTQRFPLETALQQQRDELAAQHGLQLASMTHPQKESTPWWQDVGIEYLKSDSGENLINKGLGLIKDWF